MNQSCVERLNSWDKKDDLCNSVENLHPFASTFTPQIWDNLGFRGIPSKVPPFLSCSRHYEPNRTDLCRALFKIQAMTWPTRLGAKKETCG